MTEVAADARHGMLTTTAQRPGPRETVVLHFSHSDMRAVQLVPGDRVSCKAGIFEHDDIALTPYGGRVVGKPQSRTDPVLPQAVVLRLTPELWTQCLRHRTQIIYMTDIAVVTMHLRLRPGSVVAEAGTGSGSLTHSLARTVAPTGRVYTFDFHKVRAEEAKREFAEHGLGDVVVSGWRDVCSPGEGVVVPPALLAIDPKMSGNGAAAASPAVGSPVPEDAAPAGVENPPSGYGLDAASVDAVFLDVPAPWLAVPNVLHVLREGGAVCSYSPCIEQTQKFCAALRASDAFLDLHTLECLTREFQPVFPQVSAGGRATAEHAKRSRDDTGASSAQGENRPQPAPRGAGVQFLPKPDAKGHSAYLTFARRRKYPAATDAPAADGSAAAAAA